MKCNRHALSTHSESSGITWWSYRCLECREHDVLSRNWWQPNADMLRPGDIIIVSGREWGCILYVNTNTLDRGMKTEDAAVTVLPMGRTPL